MSIFLIILSIMLWVAAFVAFPRKIIASPAFSYIALLMLSMADSPQGYPYVPVTSSMNLSWLAMTLIVTVILILQNPAIRTQSRGTLYVLLGALAGMVVGLLGYTLTTSLNLLYGIMILATAAGAFLGLLLFSKTPDGRLIAPGSGHFMTYLLAKGFPALITVAQIGIAAIILIVRNIIR